MAQGAHSNITIILRSHTPNHRPFFQQLDCVNPKFNNLHQLGAQSKALNYFILSP